MKLPTNKLDSLSDLSGFPLIEVLIILVILALGLVGLEATELKYNLLAYHRSQATQLSYDIADQTRSNITAINKYTNDPTTAIKTPFCNTTTDCSPAVMADIDLYEWNVILKSALPSGLGTISYDDEQLAVSGIKKDNLVIIKTPDVITTDDDGTKMNYMSGYNGNLDTIVKSTGNPFGRQSWRQLR